MINELIIEICEYFDEGLSPKEIADKMHISERFVLELLLKHYPVDKKGD